MGMFTEANAERDALRASPFDGQNRAAQQAAAWRENWEVYTSQMDAMKASLAAGEEPKITVLAQWGVEPNAMYRVELKLSTGTRECTFCVPDPTPESFFS